MEIRCEKCSQLAAADDVRPVAEGLGLVCAECGHVNIVSAGGDATEPMEGSDGSLKDHLQDVAIADSEDAGEEEVALLDDIEHLLPQQGPGKRCRKCAHLFEYEDLEHCARCGLSISEAEKYAAGEAPWEQPPEAKQAEYEKALQLWDAAVGRSDRESMHRFVDHVIAEELIELGMRRVQHHLVDHPDDEVALDALRQLARGLEVAVEVARTRAESKSEEFNDDVKRIRSGMMVGALIFWLVIFVLFSWMFLGNV